MSNSNLKQTHYCKISELCRLDFTNYTQDEMKDKIILEIQTVSNAIINAYDTENKHNILRMSLKSIIRDEEGPKLAIEKYEYDKKSDDGSDTNNDDDHDNDSKDSSSTSTSSTDESFESFDSFEGLKECINQLLIDTNDKVQFCNLKENIIGINYKKKANISLNVTSFSKIMLKVR